MTLNSLPISVIIPTHNRLESLKRLLNALQNQSYPSEHTEVIVVADGCEDGTIDFLREYQSPFRLRYLEQPGQGAASARNQGASIASGKILLFLDDDIQPAQQLIEAHIYQHQQSQQVVIGYLVPKLQTETAFFHIRLRIWWEEKFQTLAEVGHRFSYDDLLSGNFSVAAELFHQVGGFDPTFKCREDYELGVRLIESGARFTFAPEALGYHCDEVTNLTRSLQRKRNEAWADVQFGRCHPELMYKLRLSCYVTPQTRLDAVTIWLTFLIPGLTDLLMYGLRSCLDVLEALRLWHTWQRLNERLHGYWYLRGAIDQLKTQNALFALMQSGFIRPDERDPEIELDLQQGLEVAEKQIDDIRPGSLRIRYGNYPLGRIPPQAGVERLRGVHLRPLLGTHFTLPLFQVLTLDEGMRQ
ncbi:glycosyltransferase family A protein [Leptolyngbya sp. FACHB-17]|uniref:glycosyltransferase n=1 Tax=unclassified Leptolyngbya TaxID=2650499 RepID=UPI0016810197|nr:glycosyltransferase family A protein [Leptolyngbya sp. FACHB-17]MBD2081286.1 glycosyltransferase family 2 protein [Leptolyngbya sp. FACHB-17]